jgi:transcription antitermination factor NusG
MSEVLEGLISPPQDHQWSVIHARPRCEKKILAFCEERGIFGYCPLLTRTHFYGNRRRQFDSPMFPGYAFCVADPSGLQWLRQSRYTARLLPVPDQEALARQLVAVQLALETNEILDVLPFLQEGRPVRIASGPLKGAEGVVHRIKGRTRVLLHVDLIHQSVVIDVDSRDVLPA